MYEGDGLSKTKNPELDYQILRWFNERMIALMDIYIDIGDDIGWPEDYFDCFPRNFVEDNYSVCRRIVLDIKDILASKIIYNDMKLLYKYVLFNIIETEIEMETEGLGKKFEDFYPMDEGLVIKIYEQANYEYKKDIIEEDIEDDDEHPFFFIQSLHDSSIFYDIIFDWTEFDIDNIDAVVIEYTKKLKNREWQSCDISEYLELATRPVREEYYRVSKQYLQLDLDDEQFIIQEIDSVIKLISNRIMDIENMSENEISNYIEYMLKRVLYLNRGIEIEREAILGFSVTKLGEADMFLYRNGRKYENIAIIENKFYNVRFQEIKQLLGYMNISFKFGVTITINKKQKLGDVFFALEEYLNKEKENLHIGNIDKIGNYLIKSTMCLPELPEQIINCYHFILDMNTEDRRVLAKTARRKDVYS